LVEVCYNLHDDIMKMWSVRVTNQKKRKK